MALHEEVNRRNGDINAIIEGLISKSSLFRLQGICGAVNNNVCNSAIKNQLMRLTNDGTVVSGYSISQLAIAALDRFGIEKYEGDDSTVLNLLRAEKWFDR